MPQVNLLQNVLMTFREVTATSVGEPVDTFHHVRFIRPPTHTGMLVVSSHVHSGMGLNGNFMLVIPLVIVRMGENVVREDVEPFTLFL